jgi:hypothetical protein
MFPTLFQENTKGQACSQRMTGVGVSEILNSTWNSKTRQFHIIKPIPNPQIQKTKRMFCKFNIVSIDKITLHRFCSSMQA